MAIFQCYFQQRVPKNVKAYSKAFLQKNVIKWRNLYFDGYKLKVGFQLPAFEHDFFLNIFILHFRDFQQLS